MPAVSVIIPTYNRAKLLPQALDSVLSQTYQDFETIVVDDGSSDNTAEVVSQYKQIRYIRQENRGTAAARNKGILEARGELIAFLDSDDVWLPEMLEKTVSFIKKHNFDWVCTASYRIDDKDENKEINYIPNKFLDNSGIKIELLKNGLFFFSILPIYCGSVLLKKDCFKKVGFFSSDFTIGEDFDLWLRLDEANLKAGYLSEPLFIYRINSSSVTQSKKCFGLIENLRLAEKHAKIVGINKPLIRKSYSDFLWLCADLFYSQLDYKDSFRCLVKSWLLYPSFNKIKKVAVTIYRKLKN